jgi:glycosyltransferase involved in cell wall biosynthesis
MPAARITYVTTCKGRLHHLERTLPPVAGQAGVECIVVDYGCPDGAGDWVRERHPGVKVVSVTDDPGFNLARARNLGAAAAQSEWLAFIDADVLLAPDFFARVAPGLSRGHYFLPDSGDPTTMGSCLVERSAFLAAGGYDEAIRGWGGEDHDLYEALSLNGIRRAHYRGDLVTPIPHSDAERTRYHGNKDIERARWLNQVYRAMKFDVIRLLSRMPTLEERRHLRDMATRMVDEAATPGEAATPTQVNLPERQIQTRSPSPHLPLPRLRCSLVYELAKPGDGRHEAQEAAPDAGESAP